LIVAGVIVTLFILYYFTQSYVWNLMKIYISELMTELMTLPRNPELKILPLHTQTPLAQISRT